MFRKPNMEDVIWQRDRIQQDNNLRGEFYMDVALASQNSTNTLDVKNTQKVINLKQTNVNTSQLSCFHVFGSCMGVFKYPIENENRNRSSARNVETQPNRKHIDSS